MSEAKPVPRELSAEEALQARLLKAQLRRQALAQAQALVSLEQQVTDEEKLAELEASYPDGFALVQLNAPISGCPGFVAARDCSGPEFKRYQAGVKVRIVNKAAEVDSGDGAAQLGRVCLLYPDPDTFKRMCEQRAGLESGLGQEVVTRAQTKKADDAKK